MTEAEAEADQSTDCLEENLDGMGQNQQTTAIEKISTNWDVTCIYASHYLLQINKTHS